MIHTGYISLEQIIVQPRVAYGVIATSVVEHSWKPREEAESVPVYIVPVEEGSQRSTAMFKRCYRITRRQWLARVEGRPGCWEIPAVKGNEDTTNTLEKLGWMASPQGGN